MELTLGIFPKDLIFLDLIDFSDYFKRVRESLDSVITFVYETVSCAVCVRGLMYVDLV